ncbi:tetratricopeptide repeat protein [Dactylosporangium sp. NPDC049140]|uniref:tetratricopeptide repeat protein n=1 Tax=Dactylosporangium sp. NPDC049140 TaxID=3155647 RepID=UPI00340C0455
MTWPVQVGVVPVLADRRLDRPVDRSLATKVASNDARPVVVCQVLAGMGGVGKTQLAAGLARRQWDEDRIDLLVWVTAGSRASVITAYADAAARVTGADEADPARAANRLLEWLAEPHTHPGTGRPIRWLVILDDLTDPADLTGLWPPTTRAGRTVVTTRRRDAALTAGRQLITVDVFTRGQSVDYLRGKLGDNLGGAAELAERLGHLPLALAQAAAYIADQNISCTEYLDRLSDRARRLAELQPHALPDDQHRGVAATWDLSLDLANGMTPEGLAGPLLRLASVLDPNGIPQAVFETPAVTSWLTTLRIRAAVLTIGTDKLRHSLHHFVFTEDHASCPDRKKLRHRITQRVMRYVMRTFDDLTVAPADAYAALRRLYLLHLIGHDPESAARPVRVHALVQRATRERIAPTDLGAVVRAAAQAVADAWPHPEPDQELAQVLRTNTEALLGNGVEHLVNRLIGVHPVLFRLRRSLGEAGLLDAAGQFDRFLVAETTERLGHEHLGTLTAREYAADGRGAAGDAGGARAAHEELLADRLRILGADHPATLASRHYLIFWRAKTGDAAGAVAAFRALLADEVRVLGPDHPATLSTRGELATWSGRAGDPSDAIAAFEQLLADRIRLLGPDHPQTLITRSGLANQRGMAGHADAVAAFAVLIPDMVRVLGRDHPDTLKARSNLAYWRGKHGDPDRAVADFEVLVVDFLRVLGPGHETTRIAQTNLAFWRERAG